MKSFDNILLSFPEMDMKIQQSLKGGDGTYTPTIIPVNQDPNTPPGTSGVATVIPKFTPPAKIFTLQDWLKLATPLGQSDGSGGDNDIPEGFGGGDDGGDDGSSSYGMGGDDGGSDGNNSFSIQDTSGSSDPDDDDFDYSGYDIDTDPDDDSDNLPSGYTPEDQDPTVNQAGALITSETQGASGSTPSQPINTGPYAGYHVGDPPPGWVNPTPGVPPSDFLNFTDDWGKNWMYIPGHGWDTVMSDPPAGSGESNTGESTESGSGEENEYWGKSVVEGSEVLENVQTAVKTFAITTDGLKEAAELAFKSKAMVLLGQATGAIALYGDEQAAVNAYKHGDTVGVIWNGTKFIATAIFLSGGGEEVELAWNITSIGIDWIREHTK